jgi:hypothetical protein
VLNLKGKLKRIDSGMSKDDFALFISGNVRHKYVNTGKHTGMMDSQGNLKPIYQWDYFLWRDVQTFRAAAFIVRPEHEQEVIGTLLMLGTTYRVALPIAASFGAVMEALGLAPLKAITYGESDPARSAVSWGTISTSNVLPGATIMALCTDKCWFVYPVNIQHVNRLLSRKEKSHG